MDMLRIAVASKNAAKIRAVSAVAEELGWNFELAPTETESGVPAQPMSLEETKRGAVNRAERALADGQSFAVGLEGGVFMMEGSMYLCNWGALAANNGKTYTAAGAQIPLPEEIADQLLRGEELGPVMDRYAQETGVRSHKGAIGILTGGMMNRGDMFSHVVKLLVGQWLLDSD